jgi:2-polyprenyl-3-methyl-5-hydroxy-6-metoxy-1,4-benzoquinol methylase
MRPKTVSPEAYKTHPSYRYDRSFVLGPWSAFNIVNDPMRLTFVFSRYKFCARMLAGKRRVLEVGCGDGIGTPIVAQTVGSVTGIDIDKQIIKSNKERLSPYKNISFRTADILDEVVPGKFDAVYSLDVIEHIPPQKTGKFLSNIVKCLTPQGVGIIGTPNITSAKYASPQSRQYHVNLLSYKKLYDYMTRYFHNCFMFSMNDEVVHTGFAPMAHYLFGLGVGVK